MQASCHLGCCVLSSGGSLLCRRSKFPELESLVHHPIDYARVVSAIGNEMDVTLINLDNILPQVCIFAVRGMDCLRWMLFSICVHGWACHNLP